MNVSVTLADKLVTVISPYLPAWRARALDLGGKFQGGNKWTFDWRDEARVRAALIELYGTDGTLTELVDARVDVNHFTKHHPGAYQELWLFGRSLASRPGRDSRVKLGDGVVIVSGDFGLRGGSVKNPALDPDYETVLEVRDIPAGHADLKREGVTIVARSGPDVEALHAERETLLARLAVINELLGEV